MKPLFWTIAFAAGFGLGYIVTQADSAYIQPTPSSLPFMLLALVVVTILYQLRFNLENPPAKPVLFVVAPPNPSIFGELIAIFAGSTFLSYING